MRKRKVKKLFISDLHLGSSHCKEEVILEALHEYDFEQLAIVGDLFERGAVLRRSQSPLVDFLYKNQPKIICLDGNHDPKSDGLVAKLLRIRAHQEYAFECAGKKFLVLHGHRFDRLCFVFDEPLVDKLFLRAVEFFKRFPRAQDVIDKLHTEFSYQLAKKAAKYAAKRGKDVVICGHTHRGAYMPFVNRGGKAVDYWNCGDWYEFLTLDYEGNVERHVLYARPTMVAA